MAISVLSSGYIGLDSYVVEVEVDVSNIREQRKS